LDEMIAQQSEFAALRVHGGLVMPVSRP
jgi:hypothetical protein